MKPHISRYQGFWRFQPRRDREFSCFFGTFRSLLTHSETRRAHVGI